jgi:hypothetical protein
MKALGFLEAISLEIAIRASKGRGVRYIKGVPRGTAGLPAT